jgi:hypothetical protein
MNDVRSSTAAELKAVGSHGHDGFGSILELQGPMPRLKQIDYFSVVRLRLVADPGLSALVNIERMIQPMLEYFVAGISLQIGVDLTDWVVITTGRDALTLLSVASLQTFSHKAEL